MELIIDTNIVFSAIVKNSVARLLLLNSRLILYSPEGLLSELEEHRDEIKEKSKLSDEEYNELMAILLSRIQLEPKENISKFLKKALELRAWSCLLSGALPLAGFPAHHDMSDVILGGYGGTAQRIS